MDGGGGGRGGPGPGGDSLHRHPGRGADRRRASASAGKAGATGASAVCDGKAKKAPDFELSDYTGKKVRLADYKGKVVFVNFWATWCGPCKYEIPMFVDLQQRYGAQGLAFLGISVDDPVEELKPFVDQYKMNYPVLVGLGREDVQDAYGPMVGIPVTVVVGRDGNRLHPLFRPAPEGSLRSRHQGACCRVGAVPQRARP